MVGVGQARPERRRVVGDAKIGLDAERTGSRLGDQNVLTTVVIITTVTSTSTSTTATATTTPRVRRSR